MTQNRREALGWAGAVLGCMAVSGNAARACPGVGVTGGEDVAPGVREIFLTSQEVGLAAYKLLWMTHLVFEPGAGVPADTVANDAVVMLEQGLLRVHLDEQEFVLCNSNISAFAKGSTLSYTNTGADVAVLKVIDLLPGL
ncbi:MAG: hypothetical protein ACJ8H8_00745 [Geminicoccaceae bacterium]